MSAGAGGLQREGDVGFLAGAHFIKQTFAVFRVAAAAVEIDDQRGIDQVAMLLEEKGGTVGVAAGLFVGGECDDDVVIRNEFLAPQSNQGFRQSRIAVLHVDGTAAIEPSFSLRQLERVDRPILGFGFHHIEVPQEQDGVARVFAAVANHHVALRRMIGRREENHVAGRKARARQPALDGLRGFRGTVRMSGVDLHQAFQHVAGELQIRGRRKRRCRGAPSGHRNGQTQGQHRFPH